MNDNDATTTIERAKELLEQAHHERAHGSRVRAEQLYEQVLAISDLEEIASLLRHDALTQGGNVARLNGHFDRSWELHLGATSLFVFLTTKPEFNSEHPDFNPEDHRKLVQSQVDNLRDGAEALRKRTTSLNLDIRSAQINFRKAEELLQNCLNLIDKYQLGSAEKGITLSFLGRLRISKGDIYGGRSALLLAHELLTKAEYQNPMYLLYNELDLVEVCSYVDMASRYLSCAIRNLYTSLRYGNRKPPLHFIRAVFNLAMCCTPWRIRCKILHYSGFLIKTVPPQ